MTEFTRTLAFSEKLVVRRERDHGRHFDVSPMPSTRLKVWESLSRDLMSSGHEPRRGFEESRPEILTRACPSPPHFLHWRDWPDLTCSNCNGHTRLACLVFQHPRRHVAAPWCHLVKASHGRSTTEPCLPRLRIQHLTSSDVTLGTSAELITTEQEFSSTHQMRRCFS